MGPILYFPVVPPRCVSFLCQHKSVWVSNLCSLIGKYLMGLVSKDTWCLERVESFYIHVCASYKSLAKFSTRSMVQIFGIYFLSFLFK